MRPSAMPRASGAAAAVTAAQTAARTAAWRGAALVAAAPVAPLYLIARGALPSKPGAGPAIWDNGLKPVLQSCIAGPYHAANRARYREGTFEYNFHVHGCGRLGAMPPQIPS